MSVSQAYSLTRFMNTLDYVLLGLRDRADDLDPRSGISIVDSMRLSCLGLESSAFVRGIVFGLDLCRMDQISKSSFSGILGMPGGGGGSPLDPDEWVVTRGSLFDGTNIRNLEPTDGSEYVYHVSLPSALVGANCVAIGAVVYDTSTNGFVTRLLGQTAVSDPPRTIEKTNVSVADFVEAAFSENPKDDDLRVQPTASQILIGRFVVDVEEMDGSTSEFEMFGSPSKDRYPLPSGVPHAAHARLAVDLDRAMGFAGDPIFDSTMASYLLDPVVGSAVWGTSFYEYWMTPGRTLPINVKYYYNQIWDPDIP